MIKPHSVEEVINTSRVEEVIEEFVVLKKRGINLMGLCPFHNEKTPSFTVSPTKNIYKCFGCGKVGNSVQFMMDHEGMTFIDAIRHLAKKYSIELEETFSKNYDPNTQLEKDSLYIINEFAKDTFVHNLLESEEGKRIGLSYFKERGFRENTITKFELGFAVKQKDFLTKRAVDKGYNIESLKKLGLTSQYDSDFFRDRVMFPIHNLSGKVIAFGGRTLSADKKIPKYINSPETEIYVKSNSLYGIFQAKTAIRKADECILVEGYTDVISLSQAGVENVIASSGTSLTEGQIRLVKRYTPNMTILYDGDAAGLKAAMRGIDLILEQDMNVNIVLLPDKEDPDSYVKANGSAGLETYMNDQKKDFILFKIDLLLKEAENDPVKKTGVIKNIVESISFIPDTLKRSLYIQQCSQLLDVSEDILNDESNKMIQSRLKYQAKKGPAVNRQTDFIKPRPKPGLHQQVESAAAAIGDEYQERDVIRILLNLGHLLYEDENKTTVAEYIIINIKEILDSFDNEVFKTIIMESATMIEGDGIFSAQHFSNHTVEEVRNICIHLMHDEHVYANWDGQQLYLQSQKPPEENFVKDGLQAIMRLKERKLSRTIKEIETRLKTTPDTDETYRLLLAAYLKTKTTLSEIHKTLGTVVPSKM